ncbi:hypothetical protein Ssi03_66170 [Sphaerisporangium siamense]|uniref:Uncharacterized protein n=1 Tax=Sphaerisporangium siamense TaxID=795645 RepID=A0A7W7DFT9_9ACTN|nr:hypothetical protein [Sphaerisporangium siamense]MBB4706018.1 hypothetical protein [Sphaerisporangium siamense]GII88627.1 hypothetical protein Ssi03_66170 [Sphaerisporangium siamense]
MGRPPAAVLLTVLALSLGQAPTTAAHAAATIGWGCGLTLTTSVTLTEDLVRAGRGPIIGADDITIDLNEPLHEERPCPERAHRPAGRAGARSLHIGFTAGSRLTVADNTGTRNAGYFVYAPPGTVTDGGGNKGRPCGPQPTPAVTCR